MGRTDFSDDQSIESISARSISLDSILKVNLKHYICSLKPDLKKVPWPYSIPVIMKKSKFFFRDWRL
jgi:hypothetical protein